jgi:hypothetical protein
MFLPYSVRHYVFASPILFVFFPPLNLFVPQSILLPTYAIVWSLYGIIPQYFIARWLAKEEEDGAM